MTFSHEKASFAVMEDSLNLMFLTVSHFFSVMYLNCEKTIEGNRKKIFCFYIQQKMFLKIINLRNIRPVTVPGPRTRDHFMGTISNVGPLTWDH